MPKKSDLAFCEPQRLKGIQQFTSCSRKVVSEVNKHLHAFLQSDAGLLTAAHCGGPLVAWMVHHSAAVFLLDWIHVRSLGLNELKTKTK